MSLPEPAKSRSKTKRQEAPRLGEGSRAGPSSPGQNTASLFSQGLGPPRSDPFLPFPPVRGGKLFPLSGGDK